VNLVVPMDTTSYNLHNLSSSLYISVFSIDISLRVISCFEITCAFLNTTLVVVYKSPSIHISP